MSVGHQTNIIKEVLTRELITPQELADTLGVSIASINSWTSGRRNISTKHLRNLKKHYPDSFAKKNKPKERGTVYCCLCQVKLRYLSTGKKSVQPSAHVS